MILRERRYTYDKSNSFSRFYIIRKEHTNQFSIIFNIEFAYNSIKTDERLKCEIYD